MTRGRHFEHFTWCNVLLLNCIVGRYVFKLYVMFHLNVGDDNDKVQLYM